MWVRGSIFQNLLYGTKKKYIEMLDYMGNILKKRKDSLCHGFYLAHGLIF